MIFQHIPKTAGISVISWIVKNRLRSLIKFPEYHTSIAKLRGSPEREAFTIVRNSYTRIVSMYFHDLKTLREFNPRNIHVNTEGQIHVYRKILESTSTPTFLEWADITFANDTWWVKDQLVYAEGADHILSFENLEEDFKLIQKKVDCYEPLPFRNTNEQKELAIILLKDETVLSIIEDRYKNEIEHFGFKRPYDL